MPTNPLPLFHKAKLLPLLLATSPRTRLLGCVTAFAPLTTASCNFSSSNFSSGSRLLQQQDSPTDSAMPDEVAAAKAAAAAYRSSDRDGAGPETVFDNILSGKVRHSRRERALHCRRPVKHR